MEQNDKKDKKRKYYLENKEKYKKWRKKWHDNPENESYKIYLKLAQQKRGGSGNTSNVPAPCPIGDGFNPTDT